MTNGYSKPLPELIAELRDELKEFVVTRVALLRAEIREKVQHLRLAVPALVGGLVLVATGWLLFTGVPGMRHRQRLCPSRLRQPSPCPLALYSIGGCLALFFGWQQVKETRVTPEHTIRILKEDKSGCRRRSKYHHERPRSAG